MTERCPVCRMVVWTGLLHECVKMQYGVVVSDPKIPSGSPNVVLELVEKPSKEIRESMQRR
jgi:hypothetical protein